MKSRLNYISSKFVVRLLKISTVAVVLATLMLVAHLVVPHHHHDTGVVFSDEEIALVQPVESCGHVELSHSCGEDHRRCTSGGSSVCFQFVREAKKSLIAERIASVQTFVSQKSAPLVSLSEITGYTEVFRTAVVIHLKDQYHASRQGLRAPPVC